jgi:penicillin-binding protein 2
MAVLQGLVWAVFFYLAGGLILRQVVQHRKFCELERRQSCRRILRPAPRGNIYDRRGQLLAGNRPRFDLVVYLQELREEFSSECRRRMRRLRDRELAVDVARERSLARLAVLRRLLQPIAPFLSKPIDLQRQALDRHFAQTPLLPFSLRSDLGEEELAHLVEILPDGGPLQVETHISRHYPNGSLAAHAIGYAAPVADGEASRKFPLRTFGERILAGRSGMELALDGKLRGRNGREIWIVDPAGSCRQLLFSQKPGRGEDVFLSLDLELQRVAEAALGDEVGCAILTDVRTGEVLAMANSPSYDLNRLTPFISAGTYAELTGLGVWLNQATQGLYPPGSIFKLVSVETLLRHGAVDRGTEHPCLGQTRVGNRIIRCNNHFERGPIPFTRAFAKSCNTLVIDRIFSVPLADFLAEIRRLGFGAPTGIELPNETTRSLVPDPAWKKARGHGTWTDGDTANLAIGQGYLLVTPAQINALTASIAANRERTPLTLLLRSQPLASSQALGLDGEAYAALRDAMVECVEYGSGRRCQLPDLPIAAKTGTAQIRDGQRQSHLAWFTAFAPADAPAVAVTVMLRESEAGRSYAGGSDAAPVARKILAAFFARRETDRN